jgi:uncharacterized protein (DUF1697 family)
MSVILRTGREIADLVDANPFKSVKVTPETRPGVTTRNWNTILKIRDKMNA